MRIADGQIGVESIEAMPRLPDPKGRRGDLTDIKKGTVWRCRGWLIEDALCLTN
jgi:hypothetical protein